MSGSSAAGHFTDTGKVSAETLSNTLLALVEVMSKFKRVPGASAVDTIALRGKRPCRLSVFLNQPLRLDDFRWNHAKLVHLRTMFYRTRQPKLEEQVWTRSNQDTRKAIWQDLKLHWKVKVWRYEMNLNDRKVLWNLKETTDEVKKSLWDNTESGVQEELWQTFDDNFKNIYPLVPSNSDSK